MKLVGEYELTDQGVRFVGQIRDTHIHEVRQLLKPFKTARIYRGDIQVPGQVYHVPALAYRPYVIRFVPGVITPETEKDFIKFTPGRTPDSSYYPDGQTIMHNLGILYGDGEGRQIIDNRCVMSFDSMRPKSRLLTNSAWVWGADEGGNLDIELFGLVNRHMKTMVLAHATKLAKYIDNVLVRILDHPDMFNEVTVAERARTVRW